MTHQTNTLFIILASLSTTGCWVIGKDHYCIDTKEKCEAKAGEDEAEDPDPEGCDAYGSNGLELCRGANYETPPPQCSKSIMMIPNRGQDNAVRSHDFMMLVSMLGYWDTSTYRSSDYHDWLCLNNEQAYASAYGDPALQAMLVAPELVMGLSPSIKDVDVELCFDTARRQPLVLPHGWANVAGDEHHMLDGFLTMTQPTCPSGSWPIKMQDARLGVWFGGDGRDGTALCNTHDDCAFMDDYLAGEGLCTGAPWISRGTPWGFYHEDHGCEWWPDGQPSVDGLDYAHGIYEDPSSGTVVIQADRLDQLLGDALQATPGLAASVALDGSVVIERCDDWAPCHALGLRDGDVITGLGGGGLSEEDLHRAIAQARDGGTTIGLDRADGPATISVTVVP